MFEDGELLKDRDVDIYPLAVKAEALTDCQNGNSDNGSSNSQITQAVFEKDKGEYHGEVDANDPGKECVICLSEPRDTTVLPCRHMCMCSECAKVPRFQTNRCPICRQQPVERLLEIKVNNGADE
ncbi:hypothetical protein SASPL_135982 [Salvia splendens]|uniref:RING-type E3 ubiquitin transferase n=1 Tax=Salvia splendens TaxID=180675 RepID=A0A8X8ZG77_SALSN|nr:hypothetical protein SASPL_135982 [Salvia splendens]